MNPSIARLSFKWCMTKWIVGDPALKPQHHILEEPVQVMDLMEVKPLFQHRSHAEHLFFGTPGLSTSPPF